MSHAALVRGALEQVADKDVREIGHGALDLMLEEQQRLAEHTDERVERLEVALRTLVEEVEMAESIGICLPDRTASLNAMKLLTEAKDDR